MLVLHTLTSWLCSYHQFQFWNEVYESRFCVPGLRRLLQLLRHPFRIYGGIVTSKNTTTSEQRLNVALSWPLLLMLAVFGLAILMRYVLPLLASELGNWRPTYEGETLMVAWNLYNAGVLAIARLACVDQPIRKSTDHFPIKRIGSLSIAGERLWGTTADLSEEGSTFTLQQPRAGLRPTTGQLELVEPPLSIRFEVEPASPTRLALRFQQGSADTQAALVGEIYSSEHWFHQPRRLSTTDALLHGLGSLWRPDPILRRFD